MKNTKKEITYNEMIKRGYLKVTLSEEDFIILKADIKDNKYEYNGKTYDVKNPEELIKYIADRTNIAVTLNLVAAPTATEIAHQNLFDGVESMMNSENYKNFLKMSANLAGYSMNNKILIFSQCPTASAVMSAKQWHDKFEQKIKKDEKALWIYKPHMYKTDDEGKALLFLQRFLPTATIETLQNYRHGDTYTIISGYGVAPVFDVSQVEPEKDKPLPDITIRTQIDSYFENSEKIIDTLIKCSPVPVSFNTLERDGILNNAYGYYSRKQNKIVLREGMSPADTIQVLSHEIAHSMMHNQEMLDNETSYDFTKSIKEIEAESVSYIFCQRLGLDTECTSFGYLSMYLPQDKEKRLEELKKTYTRIDTCVKELSDKYDKQMEADKQPKTQVKKKVKEKEIDRAS